MTAPHQRSTRPGGELRVLRAAMFAAVCVVLAAAGHSLAACASVPLWSVGAGFAAVFAVAVPLAGRARSLAGIVTLLALGQTVLHTLFGLGRHGADTAAASAALDAALVERAARLVCGATAAAISPAQAQRILTEAGLGTHASHAGHRPADAVAAAGESSAGVLPSLPMLLGHVLAALAAGWVLRHGDLALLRLIRLSTQAALVRSPRAALALALSLRAGLRGAPEPAAVVPCTAPERVPAPRTAALQHSVIRRGPPARAEVVLAV